MYKIEKKWKAIKKKLLQVLIEVFMLLIIIGIIPLSVGFPFTYWGLSMVLGVAQVIKMGLTLQAYGRNQDEMYDVLLAAYRFQEEKPSIFSNILGFIRQIIFVAEIVCGMLRDGMWWKVTSCLIIVSMLLYIVLLIMLKAARQIAGIYSEKEAYILADWEAKFDYEKEKGTIYDGMDGKSYKRNLKDVINWYYEQI